MRTPRLTAGYAIGPALGHCQAVSPGKVSAAYGSPALTVMACKPDETECPPGSNLCCTADQWRHRRADGTHVCLDYPPAPPPSPTSSAAPGPAPVSARVGG